jgi:hypothetical protein
MPWQQKRTELSERDYEDPHASTDYPTMGLKTPVPNLKVMRAVFDIDSKPIMDWKP